MQRVAYQGAAGAYSEEAVLRACGNGVVPVPMRENREVTRAVAAGEVELGVLPVANTLAGSVDVSYDAILAEPSVHAIGEIVLPIHHCVLGVPGASLETLRSVESHPVALAQCRRFFEAHPSLMLQAVYDTAGAAQEISVAGDIARGALASRLAAERYGLQLLAADVEDRPDNRTRFIVLSRTPVPPPEGSAVRTILVVTLPHQPGALYRLLTPLAERELNLLSLESRPTGEDWTYRFILEFEHRAGEKAPVEAMETMAGLAVGFRVVGTFMAAAVGDDSPGSGLD